MATSDGITRRTLLLGGAGAAALAGCRAGRRDALPRASSAPSPAPPVPHRRPSSNPYLSGNFAPVDHELTASRLPVAGSIPKGLHGTLLRNGPNPIAPDTTAYHWFLGDGMVHAFELRDGEARYRNRWVRTDTAARLLHEPPIAGQVKEVNPAPNAAQTSLVAHAGRTLALFEVSLPTQVDSRAVTVGRYDFGGELRSPMTAHPKIDPATGELLFFGLDIFGPPYLRFHVADPHGNLVLSKEITIPGPSMMHDFAVTERHVVFLDLPVVYDLTLLDKQPFPARWKPDYGARIGVMPRDAGSAPRWFDVEPSYVFHTVNAYDEGDSVVVDVVRHAQMFVHDLHGVGDGTGTLERWTIDLGTGRVREERVDDRLQEFPQIDQRVRGNPYRYAYTTTARPNDFVAPFGTLLRHDMRSGTATAARLEPGLQAGEAIFVPADAAASEGEGWVLTVVYDPRRDRSDLLVLDATDFGRGPVATVALPQRVPFGFHGTWEPAAA